MKMLQGHVSGICCSDTSPLVNCYYHNCATPILGTLRPRDKSHGVQLVELFGTRRGDKTLQGCHVPQCVLHTFLSLLHVAATCHCYMIASVNQQHFEKCKDENPTWVQSMLPTDEAASGAATRVFRNQTY